MRWKIVSSWQNPVPIYAHQTLPHHTPLFSWILDKQTKTPSDLGISLMCKVFFSNPFLWVNSECLDKHQCPFCSLFSLKAIPNLGRTFMTAVLEFLKGVTSLVRYFLWWDIIFVTLLVANKPFGTALGICIYFCAFLYLRLKSVSHLKCFSC